MAAAEFIRVNARVRPSGRENLDRSVLHLDEVNAHIDTVLNRKFHFDQVFGPSSSQDAIFRQVGKRIMDGALDGINGTIFAYGQTGSGKTHTMLGPAHEKNFFNSTELKGLIPRCVEYLFTKLESYQAEKGSRFQYTVSCMFVELYNECLSDLLAENCPAITIRAETRNVMLQGATCETVTSFIDAMRLVQIGWDNRHVGETAMNKESSRSHAVLILDVVTTEDDGGVINKREARINLVDLAGSERQSHIHSVGVRLKEAGKINQSLCTLGRVIRDLSSKKAHVPYRDSRLTLMIRDSLGGNSRTSVIVCVHPDEAFLAESLSTLQFAERCRLIKNELHVNREVTGESVAALQARIVELEDEKKAREAATLELEERLRKAESAYDYYRNQTAGWEFPPNSFKTPAHDKSRRRTKFNPLSTQRAALAATRACNQPVFFEETIDSFESKENNPETTKDEDLIAQMKTLLETTTQDNKKLQDEKFELKAALDDREKTVLRLEVEMNAIVVEKDRIRTELTTVLARHDELEKTTSELVENLARAQNEIDSYKSRLDACQSALNCEEVKVIEHEKKIKEHKKIASVLIAEKDKFKHKCDVKDKEIQRLQEVESQSNLTINEKDKYIQILRGQVNFNKRLVEEGEQWKLAVERLTNKNSCLEMAAFEHEEEKVAYAEEKKALDKQMKKTEAEMTILKYRLELMTQDLASVVAVRDELQNQVNTMTRHANGKQTLDLASYLRLKSTSRDFYKKCLEAERFVTVNMYRIFVQEHKIGFTKERKNKVFYKVAKEYSNMGDNYVDLLLQTRFKIDTTYFAFASECADYSLDRAAALLKNNIITIGLLELYKPFFTLEKFKNFIEKFNVSKIEIHSDNPIEFLCDTIVKKIETLCIRTPITLSPEFILQNHMKEISIIFTEKPPLAFYRRVLMELKADTRYLTMWSVGPFNPDDIEKIFLGWMIENEGSERYYKTRPLVTRVPMDIYHKYQVFLSTGKVYNVFNDEDDMSLTIYLFD